MLLDRLFRTVRLDRIYCLIFLLNSINCLEKKLTSNEQEYGIDSVADIIAQSQQSSDQSNNLANNRIIKNNQFSNNQTDFRPSNWNERNGLRKMKRLDDRLRKYQKREDYRSRDDDHLQGSIKTPNNYQFKRRSDLDEDYYYSPHYYSANSPYTAHHHLIYPPAVQPVISVPINTPAVLGTPSTTYYGGTRYRPAASRHHHHRIYPSVSTSSIRRRLTLPTNSNYDAMSYYHPITSASTPNSYYYGTGLASPQPSYSYSQAAYPHHHAVSHPSPHAIEQEGKEVHSLLPIITVIGIGSFMIPLLVTFFTAMLSNGGSCCGQRQKERANNPRDVRESFYDRMKDVWRQVEKAINSQW